MNNPFYNILFWCYVIAEITASIIFVLFAVILFYRSFLYHWYIAILMWLLCFGIIELSIYILKDLRNKLKDSGMLE